MIFQEPMTSLNPLHSIEKQINEVLGLHKGLTGKVATKRTLELLELVGIPEPHKRLKALPHELSGGQRQRVAIASAIVLQPALVVADEPVSMLDVSARAGILRLMLDLRDRLGISYLFITHDLSVAWILADRIAVAYLGRIVEIGPATELVSAPSHPYTQALLAASRESGSTDGRGSGVLSGETPSASAVPSGCRFHPRCPLYRALGEPAQCRTADPTLRSVADPARSPGAHQSACHFAQENS